MKNILVTGSGGLVGSETVRFYCNKGYNVIGIDNDMRKYFFGDGASTSWNVEILKKSFPNHYTHYNTDIRDFKKIEKIFKKYCFELVIHTASQPSHDWAAREPQTDFSVNANGTLNMLEGFRKYADNGVFIFTSTNKVYGDTPNYLPLIELESRWEIDKTHKFYERGIDETMSIDQSKHSLFGVSKVAADVLVQEYGRYFGLKTACFRAGCITGSHHSGAELHGFLAYLAKCILTGKKYYIYGYKAKQVRDNIHSFDLVNAFDHFFNNPRIAEVYNIGGARYSNVSMKEAIEKIEKKTGKKANTEYTDKARIGDHIWYVSDVSKFQQHYPNWKFKYNIDSILDEIIKNIHL